VLLSIKGSGCFSLRVTIYADPYDNFCLLLNPPRLCAVRSILLRRLASPSPLQETTDSRAFSFFLPNSECQSQNRTTAAAGDLDTYSARTLDGAVLSTRPRIIEIRGLLSPGAYATISLAPLPILSVLGPTLLPIPIDVLLGPSPLDSLGAAFKSCSYLSSLGDECLCFFSLGIPFPPFEVRLK